MSELGVEAASGDSAVIVLEKTLSTERHQIAEDAERKAAARWEAERFRLIRECDERIMESNKLVELKVRSLETSLLMVTNDADALREKGNIEVHLNKSIQERATLEQKVASLQKT